MKARELIGVLKELSNDSEVVLSVLLTIMAMWLCTVFVGR